MKTPHFESGVARKMQIHKHTKGIHDKAEGDETSRVFPFASSAVLQVKLNHGIPPLERAKQDLMSSHTRIMRFIKTTVTALFFALLGAE
jgi:hypothetical protein